MSEPRSKLRRLPPGTEAAMGPSDVAPSDVHAVDFVRRAEMGDGWLHPAASNYTFIVELALGDIHGYGVYKPVRGEAPLWDFPSGLYKRECAAYELSCLLGWQMVPPTLVRDDGDLGTGSLQLFVPPQGEAHYFELRETHRDEARRLALFDWIANNADRKGGHCLVAQTGGVWAIDNGLTFHEEPKLRTVIWDFAGEAVPDALLADLKALTAALRGGSASDPGRLAELLTPGEMEALEHRTCSVLDEPVFPGPVTRRDVPWPVI